MIQPDSIQSRFSSAYLRRLVSHARICNFLIILNIYFVGKYRVPRMRFERTTPSLGEKCSIP